MNHLSESYTGAPIKAQTELGIKQTVNLELAIKKTVLHIKENSSFSKRDNKHTISISKLKKLANA